MGDPKFSRRLYDTPSHPWKTDRIQEENALIRKFGLKNKKEVWRAKSQLGRFRGQARRLVARIRTGDLQAEKEKELLIKRLSRMGLLGEGATLDEVLSLNVENLLSRRLQTIMYLKGMAHTPKQARQFIVHGHASIGGRKVTIPSYMVLKEEEEGITYRDASPLADEAHAERPGSDKFKEEHSDGTESQVKKTIKLETGEDSEEGEKGKKEGEKEGEKEGKGKEKDKAKAEDKKEEGDKADKSDKGGKGEKEKKGEKSPGEEGHKGDKKGGAKKEKK
jgi:small subunit ribosomal protein S4